MVATPHHAATAIAERALADGGNAIDAALAAAAALTVAYPHNCALGGDLFALVRTPDGRTVSVNASGPAGSLADRGRLRARHATMPAGGPETITVPGLVAGWDAVHGLGAALPWARALEPSVALARGGVRVTPRLAEAIAEAAGALADPGMRAVFAPRGTPLTAGEILRQPALASTLETLAADGARAFYAGGIAERLVAGLTAAGATVTAGDLDGFAPERTAPLRAGFRGYDVLTSPPNSSGFLLLRALAALEATGVDEPLGAGAGMLAEILLAGAEERDRRLGDPRATAARPSGDTVAVVASDASGTAVSLIQSLFRSFGARYLEPSTGVLLHNRGAMFSLEPGHPNALEPGRRPAHTLMPVIVERAGRLAGVLGTMGGKVHAQIHAQVLLRLLAGATPQEAVDAPRWIAGAMDAGEPEDTIRIEEGCGAEARAALARTGLRVVGLPRGSEWLGHAQAIWLDPEPRAGSDFRADGRRAAAAAATR